MKKIIAIVFFTLSLSVSAFADNPRRRVEFYDNSGTLQELDNFQNPAMVAVMMQHAKKLAPGTIVMTADGQAYILQDFKMPNGQMLSKQLMAH